MNMYIYTHNVLLFEFTTHPVGVTKKSQVDELAKTIGLKFRQDTAWCVMSGLQKRRFYLVLFHIYIYKYGIWFIYIYIYRYGSYPTDMRYKMDINLFKNGAIP